MIDLVIVRNACADYTSLIPTIKIVSPVAPSCTPTASPSATTVPSVEDTATPGVRIDTAVSANNISSPQAGSSASISVPTSAPDTGRVK